MPKQRLWDVLVDPARKIRIGTNYTLDDDDSLVAEVIDNTTFSLVGTYVSYTMVLRRI